MCLRRHYGRDYRSDKSFHLLKILCAFRTSTCLVGRDTVIIASKHVEALDFESELTPDNESKRETVFVGTGMGKGVVLICV